MALTGNKGEWSEIYALFKLLGDKTLHAGDADLNRIEELVYPIIKVLRTELSGKLEYIVQGDLIVVNGAGKSIKIPIEQFKQQAVRLLKELQKVKRGTFSLPEVELFMNSVNCKTIKAKSSVKTDITIVIHDLRTGMMPALGFSIKSNLGSPSTLLNASGHTNFVYQFPGNTLDKSEIKKFNEMDKFKNKFDYLRSIKKHAVYFDVDSMVFKNNLMLVDSLLPAIIGNLTYQYYSGTQASIVDLCNIITKENPLKYDYSHKHEYYNYKVKRFLTDVTVGLMPATMWSGKYDATGGYLVIKENGEVLCYHVYNRNEFEDYLFKNTRLDTPSTSRHGFGEIYIEGGKQLLKLNLQIRFK